MNERRWLLVLILGTSLLRAGLAASVGPGNDEAYYALFAIHLDWSYFDHPPMMAIVARLGMLLSGGWLEIWALRAGFILLAAGSTWLMARLTARFYGERAGLIAAVVLNSTAYYGIAAGTFVLPDGPLLFFWLLTLDRLAVAIDAPERVGSWVWVGIAWGGAMLSKYLAVFLPMGALLYVVAEPSARRCVRRVGPYLAAGVGLILFSPVLVWNARHGWASFAFQGERVLSSGGLKPLGLVEAIGGQALYLTPWIWLFLWVAIIRARRDERVPADRFFLSQAVLPVSTFLFIALQRPTLPHWSLVGMIAAFPLLGRDWSERDWPRVRRRLAVLIAVPVVGAGLLVLQTRFGTFQKGGDHRLGIVPPESDPTTDMFGWTEVAAELRRRGLLDRPGGFVFTSKWYDSGHLAYATGGRVPVLCYSPQSPHNFAYWQPPARWVGHDGVLVVVGETSTEPWMFDRWFDRIEPIGGFAVARGGVEIRRVRLYRCVNQRSAFPDLPQGTAPGFPPP